ncbi:unnamed protein product [Durusdinium trenchii]|uniref:Uncharacterized protein n=1 Tax=Durusdinium trenchii TaxID=1381693 RepID=A0ABP0HLI6_9DINO
MADRLALSRELLRCQLDDLDIFLRNARRMELPSLPSMPKEEREQVPVAPLDSAEILEAQLQNVQSVLSDMQGPEAMSSLSLQVGHSRDDLLASLPAGGQPSPKPGTLAFAPRSLCTLAQADPLAKQVYNPDAEHQHYAGLFDLDIERSFKAWSACARRTRILKRQKREENSRRWMGKKARAQALWNLVAGLYGFVETYQPLSQPHSLPRGARICEPGGRFGAFLSCSDKGMCKVLFDGLEEAELLAAAELQTVRSGAHPYAASVAFLAWALHTVTEMQLRTNRLRSELAYHRAWGKIGRALMTMTSFTEKRLAVKLTLRRWRSFVAQKESERHRVQQLAKAFKAWFEALVTVKYNNIMDQLERAQAELQEIRQQGEKAEWRTDKMKERLEEMFYMEVDLWCTWVLGAWRWAAQLQRADQHFALQARLARAQQTLKLSEAFGQVGVTFAKPHFQAWVTMVKQDRTRRRLAAQWFYGVSSETMEKIFNAWRGLKHAEYQRVSEELRRKEQDLRELHTLSSHLYVFSEQSCQRATRMESALLAAERAMELSGHRGDDLERQALELQQQVHQHEEANELQRQQYEAQMDQRFEAQRTAALQHLQVLRAELSASEDQQVHLHQELGALRQQSEEKLRSELEAAMAQEAREREEQEEERAAAERRAKLEEAEVAEQQRRAALAREHQLAMRKREEAQLARAQAWRQKMAGQESPRAETVAEPPKVHASEEHEEVGSQGDDEEEASGYTRDEWMDFFQEEGLSEEELQALETLFDHLQMEGDIPVETLNEALNDPKLGIPAEQRESLLHFLHDVT